MTAAAARADAAPFTVEVPDWTLALPSGIVPVHLPRHLDGLLGAHPPTYLLRARVELPAGPREGPWTLVFPSFPARAELRADGLEAPALDPAMRRGFRGAEQHAYRVPEAAVADGVVDLELRVSYKNLRAGWIDVAPRLSATEGGDAAFRAVRAVNQGASTACLVVVVFAAFTFAIVWARDRRRTTHGWFALQSLVGAGGYAFLATGFAALVFGPWENAVLTPMLSFGVLTSVQFTRWQLGLTRPHWAWWAGLGASVALALACASPWLSVRWAVPSCVLMMLANVAYQVPVTFRTWLRRGHPVDAAVIGISWAALGVLGLADTVAWLGLGELWGGLRLACVGLGLVAVLQSMVLGLEHDAALRRSEQLNAELRRQIAARADAIADALTRVTAVASSERRLEVGDLVEGRYRVARRVGEGAGGEVYEVTRAADGERLAMKVLRPTSDPTEIARFVREAQIIAQIDHPHVVRIVDVDVSPAGHFFLVFEFVEGLSLRSHTGLWGRRGWALEVLRQVAGALEAIHARGVVHRDLKPSNVLLVRDDPAAPLVKIADFGISAAPAAAIRAFAPDAVTQSATGVRAPGAGSSGAVAAASAPGDRLLPPPSGPRAMLTQTGVWLGTPKYMAPELAEGSRDARASADVFAFGVMAYELLAKAEPFEDAPLTLRLRGRAFVPARGLPPVSPPLPPRLAALIERSLAEQPEARPTAAELASALAGA